jgi:lipopolysaccharide export LptBFGC system permease protein LptF
LEYKLKTQTAPPVDPEMVEKLELLETENLNLKANLAAIGETTASQNDIDDLKSKIELQKADLQDKSAKIEDMEQEIQILRKKGQEEEQLSANLDGKIADLETKN